MSIEIGVFSFPSGLTCSISHSIETVTAADYYREVRNRRDTDFYREPQPVEEGDEKAAAIGGPVEE